MSYTWHMFLFFFYNGRHYYINQNLIGSHHHRATLVVQRVVTSPTWSHQYLPSPRLGIVERTPPTFLLLFFFFHIYSTQHTRKPPHTGVLPHTSDRIPNSFFFTPPFEHLFIHLNVRHLYRKFSEKMFLLRRISWGDSPPPPTEQPQRCIPLVNLLVFHSILNETARDAHN